MSIEAACGLCMFGVSMASDWGHALSTSNAVVANDRTAAAAVAIIDAVTVGVPDAAAVAAAVRGLFVVVLLVPLGIDVVAVVFIEVH
eukprot:CAMPEP_0206516444 /NCGR_PEP_ID=MMETSP0324_2-20121206/63379_1 /ASSEMBLY_ACC=CAM_ASM_000836 /TAXON_ID=2866 /ORGANISM="Crypthecodinium cohnii, Strain Seligo" /LENGTH=86 /DNA_ID=CAMNT_0054009395 /DNA_START=775 /DNA_END=1034 /DNA_ORIENTATION=-